MRLCPPRLVGPACGRHRRILVVIPAGLAGVADGVFAISRFASLEDPY